MQGGYEKIAIFDQSRFLSEIVQDTARFTMEDVQETVPYLSFRMVLFSMTPSQVFKVTPFFHAEYLTNGYTTIAAAKCE